jgi:hypothetical protein
MVSIFIALASMALAHDDNGFITLGPPPPTDASVVYTISTQTMTVYNTRTTTMPHPGNTSSTDASISDAKFQDDGATTGISDWWNQMTEVASSAMSSMTLHKFMRISTEAVVTFTTFVTFESTVYEDVIVTVENAEPTNTVALSSAGQRRDIVGQAAGRRAIL